MLIVFDIFLCTALVGSAWWSLTSRSLYKAVLLFIVFGLLLALIWARLHAVDIALAEAAIGAGITGALLITAISRVDSTEHSSSSLGSFSKQLSFWSRRITLGTLSIALGGVLVWVIFGLPAPPDRLRYEVLSRLDNIGIENPVTAVLLDFRGYDTLLEVAVLMLATVALWSVAGRPKVAKIERPEPSLGGMVRLLVPTAIMIAGYILWRGADQPGGAFQAGAVLAGAGVLITVSWPVLVRRLVSDPMTRLGIALGPLAFLIVGIGTAFNSGIFLKYPQGFAPALMLIIETAVMVSVAIILLLLFLGCRRSNSETKAVTSLTSDEDTT